MAIRRLSFLIVLVAALAGCSSGSSTGSNPTPAAASDSSRATASPMTPKASATAGSEVPGGGATDFCGAFTELKNAGGAITAVAAGAAFRSAAADIRTYAPAEIKAAAGTYADVMDNIGKAAQSGAIDQQSLQSAVTTGLAGKATDIATVAKWVATNCAL